MIKQADLQLNEYNWHVQLRDEADESVFSEIFKLHEYRIADEVIKQAMYPIIDVGAHAGFFSMHVRSLNKKIKIFAVEPEPENIKMLSRHIKENNIAGITIVESALAFDSGSRNLVVSPDSHNHHLADQEFGIVSSAGSGQAVKIKALSFADLLNQHKIKKVSLLKMDIEGGEYEVFGSMSEADLAMVNYIILEYHNGREKSKEIEEKLRTSGFGVQIFPSKFDKTMGFMFAHNKRFKS